MNELEKPEWPTAEFPKSKPPNPEFPNREPLKFDIERLGENDENDVNRDDLAPFVEKRFELNPTRGARAFDSIARLALKFENPEVFMPNDAFLGFPNACHWPSSRTWLP